MASRRAEQTSLIRVTTSWAQRSPGGGLRHLPCLIFSLAHPQCAIYGRRGYWFDCQPKGPPAARHRPSLRHRGLLHKVLGARDQRQALS